MAQHPVTLSFFVVVSHGEEQFTTEDAGFVVHMACVFNSFIPVWKSHIVLLTDNIEGKIMIFKPFRTNLIQTESRAEMSSASLTSINMHLYFWRHVFHIKSTLQPVFTKPTSEIVVLL